MNLNSLKIILFLFAATPSALYAQVYKYSSSGVELKLELRYTDSFLSVSKTVTNKSKEIIYCSPGIAINSGYPTITFLELGNFYYSFDNSHVDAVLFKIKVGDSATFKEEKVVNSNKKKVIISFDWTESAKLTKSTKDRFSALLKQQQPNLYKVDYFKYQKIYTDWFRFEIP